MPQNSHSLTAPLTGTQKLPEITAKDIALWRNRMAEGKASSERRLKSIRANNLAPSRNVKNYTNAFKEHALAIGMVGGKHQTITDSKNSLNNYGPRLNGIIYSDDEGRFSTPHSLLTYVNESNYGKSAFSNLVISDKSIPAEPFAIKFFSSDHGLNPDGGPATASNPATRVLVFDFDQKDNTDETIKNEVFGVCQILHDSGLYNWIVDVSAGGYHVIAMLNRPVLLNDVAGLFGGIQQAFVTLDIQMMTSASGAISVPFSRGKYRGGHRLLAHARNEHFIHQRRINSLSDWDEISDRLYEAVRAFDRNYLRALHYDHHAVKLVDRANDMWKNSTSVRHMSKDRSVNDHLIYEQKHLSLMDSKEYPSASEERYSIAGAMMNIYGFSEEAMDLSITRLLTSNDPMPARYRELVKNSSGKISLKKAVNKDLASAREKSTRPRGWVGLVNGSSFSKVAVNSDIEFTAETRGLIRHLLDSFGEETSLKYRQLAVLRSYLQFANARHHEHLNAVERNLDEVPDNPFDTPVPFALSMVTRLTGMAHATAYAHSMSCNAGISNDEDRITECRASGQKRGLFCDCHPEWEPYFEVSHLGHAGENDNNNRAHECRDHSFCTSQSCEGRARSSTFVKFKTYPSADLTADHTESWVYQYLVSRDPIFNESALGAAGFHMYTLISQSEEHLYLDDLDKHKLPGVTVQTAVSALIDAGLVGRHTRRGKLSFLVHNEIKDGSLAYRLRHERQMHANDQQVGFKSAMMGTGDITQFVLGFSSDMPRLYAVAREVLNYKSADDEHEPAKLLDTEGNPVLTVRDFCRSHDLPLPPKRGTSFKRGVMEEVDCTLTPNKKHGFSYVIDEAEVREPHQLFDTVHWRDDFIATTEQLSNFDAYLFGTEFTPSQALAVMFKERIDLFLDTQERIAEQEQNDTD